MEERISKEPWKVYYSWIPALFLGSLEILSPSLSYFEILGDNSVTMLTEDYLMRMINLALAAILRAAGLKVAGQYREGLQVLDQALEGLFGMRADLLKRLEDEVLLQTLTEQGKLDPDLLLTAADIFKEEGEINRLQGHSQEALDCFLRALTFTLEAGFLLQESHPNQVIEKVDGLLLALKDSPLPIDTRFGLFCFYEEYGNDARAEEFITSLYHNPQTHDQIRSEYESFMARMKEKKRKDHSE